MGYKIGRRTFEAEKYQKGSAERKKLNESGLTSEYMHSHKYHLKGANLSTSYRSNHEAEEAVKRMKGMHKLSIEQLHRKYPD